jgi:Tfp pilus assembly protein PilF
MPYIWSVPCPRNAHFTGREPTLKDLKDALTGGSGRVVTLYGAGGVGKTQVAAEYAYRHGGDYAVVWWVRAEEPTTLLEDLTELASRLGVGGSDGGHGNGRGSVHAELREALAQRNDWLLIFDNAVEPEMVASFLPPGQGSVLVTGRVPGKRSAAKGLLLSGLQRADSITFLKKRGGKNGGEASVEKVAQALGDLPLALEQAAALVRYSGITYHEFLRRFEHLWAEYLKEGAGATHPDATAMTWELSYRELRERYPVAADLLTLCSLFAAEDLGLDFLRRGAECAPYPLADVLADPAALQKAVLVLMRYALVKANDRSISLHRTVSRLVRERLAFEQQVDWARVALAMLATGFPFDPEDVQTWKASGPVIPHALIALRHAEDLGIERALVAHLYNNVGLYLHHRAAFEQAKQVFEHALMLARSVYGSEHPRVAGVSNNLARTLTELGDAREARGYLERAIEIDRKRYGDQDPHVASLANNYGRVLFHTGEADAARQQFEWALMVFRNTYGNEHSRVAAVMNNVGFIDRHAGDLTRAREQLEEAMGVAIAAGKADHPMMACIRMNLGRVHMAQGDFGGARLHFEKALVIDDEAFGREHRDVARDLIHMGNLEMEVGHHADALRYYRDALEVIQKVFGPTHTYTADCLNRLGKAAKGLGDEATAKQCFGQCSMILAKLNGDDRVVQLRAS